MDINNINNLNLKKQFKKDGFVLIKNAINNELLEEMQKDSELLANSIDSSIKQKVWHERVLFRRLSFRKFIQTPIIFELAELLIGNDIQLLAADLKKQSPGAMGIEWHRDVNFICNKTLSMNSGIYFQDISEELGAFEIIPGSHKRERMYSNSELESKKIKLFPKKGDIIFFDAGILHKANPNTSQSKERWALFLFFGHYWIKRMGEYFHSPLPDELSETNSAKLQQLLGIRLRDNVTSYHGDNEEYNLLRGEPGLDF
ncbi:phytanoyl-CoA dioxygenase family protein [Francisella sp. SYW-9]|uniref:phytanoyl-CoA dioxygenase family protein n=1 Tax=Francisella sp. SYW-9 TaxID=2610888 RepID=UPI00123E26C3|nr:phytanoyl-CoA dioxygenase family protein [Francisella sp. SYW-9]